MKEEYAAEEEGPLITIIEDHRTRDVQTPMAGTWVRVREGPEFWSSPELQRALLMTLAHGGSDENDSPRAQKHLAHSAPATLVSKCKPEISLRDSARPHHPPGTSGHAALSDIPKCS